VIIDLNKFITKERPYWEELEEILDSLENRPEYRLNLERLKHFHYLYQRASADLAKIMTFSSEPNIRRFLESLVARSYGEIHETRTKPHKLSLLKWFFKTFPDTFRRHINAFWISVAAMLVGCAIGGFAISYDSDAKEVLLPLSHLQIDPSERVTKEEEVDSDRLDGGKITFSSFLMTHNTKVSIYTLALGVTYGIGTVLMLFYNGIILGSVIMDYILAGESPFLIGWLLPHGSIEIPAILIAGQSGLVLASALIGHGTPVSLKNRLRLVSGDLVTLIGGTAVMLVWAGIIEAFFSQYHEPVLPYEVKIGFGIIEMIVLVLFLGKSGLKKHPRGTKSMIRLNDIP